MPWATIWTAVLLGVCITAATPLTRSSPIANQQTLQNESWSGASFEEVSTTDDGGMVRMSVTKEENDYGEDAFLSSAVHMNQDAVDNNDANKKSEVSIELEILRSSGTSLTPTLVTNQNFTATESAFEPQDHHSPKAVHTESTNHLDAKDIGLKYRVGVGQPLHGIQVIEKFKVLQRKHHNLSHYELTKIAESPSDFSIIQLLVEYSPPPESIGYTCWYDPNEETSPTPEVRIIPNPSSVPENYELDNEDEEANCQSCELDDDGQVIDDEQTNEFYFRPLQAGLEEGAVEDQLFIEGIDEYFTRAHLEKILQSGLLNADTFSAEDRRRRPLINDGGSDCKCQVSQEETLCTREDNAYCDNLPGSEVPSGILEVSGTNISYLGVNSLIPFHNVSVMKLANNQLARIDPGTFKDMSLLRNLSLSYNHLTELHPNVFAGAPNLREVLVSFNKFRSIINVTQALSRKNTPNLIHLSLAGNIFPRIKRSDFKPLASTTLRDLQLHENAIIELAPDTFDDLLHLRRLRLRHNPLDLYQLYQMLLHMQSSSLEMIDISGLGRYSILSFFQVFQAISKSEISALQLNNYCFFSIMQLNFPMMSNIKVLSMSECGLHTIYAKTFDKFPALEQLILTDNRFGYIPSAAVLPNLVLLDISRTTFLPDVLFKVYEYQFRDMNSLQYLDISMNNIQILGRGSFYGLENLTTLVLNDAEILYIEEFTFSMLENLTELYLSRNPLGQHDFHNTWSGLTNLKVLFLDNCSISKSDLYLHDMPELELIKMSSNRLHNFTDQTFRGLKKLNAIDLSSNEIESWHTEIFHDTENLTRIYLHNNHIDWVTESMVTDFRNTRVITLRENPYLCDCMLYYWLLWEERSSSWNASALADHTSDVDQCTCHMPPMAQGVKVLDFYLTMEHSPCKHSDTHMLIAMIPVFLSGFLLAVLSSILWRNRWYVRYWIFKLTSKRWLKRLRGKPAGYQYDAFVSYSSQDGELVLEMMDHLEQRPPFYRLCVYERDFEIGNVISECILESINMSRKTILILSDHFAKSNWCRWEMSLVQCRLFEQKRDDLIIVKLGKLRSRHLTPTIKYLMRTRVYIEWGPSAQQQMLFWEKLRAALRQPSGLPRLPRTV